MNANACEKQNGLVTMVVMGENGSRAMYGVSLEYLMVYY